MVVPQGIKLELPYDPAIPLYVQANDPERPISLEDSLCFGKVRLCPLTSFMHSGKHLNVECLKVKQWTSCYLVWGVRKEYFYYFFLLN